MAYDQQYQFSTQTVFRQRVMIALCNAAVAIMAEANSVPGHALRTELANKVLLAPERYVPAFALAILSDDSTTPSDNDAMLQGRVNSLWNAWAGVIN